MTLPPLDSPNLTDAHLACLRELDGQRTEHLRRRLPGGLAQHAVTGARAMIANMRGEAIFAPWTSRIDCLVMAEISARQQEEHQLTVLDTMSKHARELFTLGAREGRSAARRAAQATESASLLEATALAAEREALGLQQRLTATGGIGSQASPVADPRPDDIVLALEAEQTAARAATGQLSALVGLWSHDVEQLRQDGSAIYNLRHRFFADTVRLQEDVWQTCPRVVVVHPCGGAATQRPYPPAVLLNRGRAQIHAFQAASWTLGQFYRERTAHLAAQQISLCQEVDRALGESLAQALQAVEQRAVQQARVATCQAKLVAMQAQLASLAAEELCLRAGLSPQLVEAAEGELSRAGPTLRRT